MIGLGASLASDFRDGHLTCLGKQLRQMALVTRIEMLNQHECHAGIVWEMAEQFREGFQSPSGCTYTDNERRVAFGTLLAGERHDSGTCRGGLPNPGRS